MRILKVKTNSELDKALATVFDLALKAGGLQVFPIINFIQSSFQAFTESEAGIDYKSAESEE